MIPILYDATETAFTSNGLGRLSECTSCKVTEVRNGIYECEFIYPITGRLYDQIQEGMIVSCTHDNRGDRQPFIIYRRSAPINGLVQFMAHHYTYLLNDIILEAPAHATSAGEAFAKMSNSTTPTNPFTMWTDVTTVGTFTRDIPVSVRAALGGTQGSVLDVYGGEYEWDGMSVKLHAQRGTNSGVTVRYGKNLTDLTQTYDVMGVYNAVYPYWYDDQTDTLVVLPDKIVKRQDVTNPIIKTLDLSNEFDEEPRVDQLRAKATSWLNEHRPWIPSENIRIKFAQLWQTEEYKNVAILQRLSLCDRVNVYYQKLGIIVNDVEIIKVVYNVLLDSYDEMELGDAQSSFADTILKPLESAIGTALQGVPTKSYVQAAIDHATELITGGMGGNIVFVYDGDGKPVEMLVMDNEDPDLAQHVLRINVNGIGFSSNGIDGPFTSAWTLDGQFVANFITAGELDAGVIKAGILADEAGFNFWNLETGEFSLSRNTRIAQGSNVITLGDLETYQLEAPYVWNSTNTIASFAAVLYHSNIESQEDYPPQWFKWSLKDETRDRSLARGRTVEVYMDEVESVGSVTLTFRTFETRNLLTRTGKQFLTPSGNTMTIWVESQD